MGTEVAGEERTPQNLRVVWFVATGSQETAECYSKPVHLRVRTCKDTLNSALGYQC